VFRPFFVSGPYGVGARFEAQRLAWMWAHSAYVPEFTDFRLTLARWEHKDKASHQEKSNPGKQE